MLLQGAENNPPQNQLPGLATLLHKIEMSDMQNPETNIHTKKTEPVLPALSPPQPKETAPPLSPARNEAPSSPPENPTKGSE